MNENYSISQIGDEENNLINFIFKKGTKNLLCIALNPKEENEQQTISQNVDFLANYNGYDGWFLCFINPTISNESHTINKYTSEINENYLLIGALIMNEDNNLKDVLVCWGSEIENFNQVFLKQSCYKILKDLEKDDMNFFSIGLDKIGNPDTVSSTNFETKIKNFNYKKYLEKIKSTTKIEPEITINGIEFK